MSYLVLARKWRPQALDELVGQEPIARILRSALGQNKVAHAYVFSGPRGVGKTSTARILAKALNCEQGPTADPCNDCAACRAITDGSSLDVTEIDGASNTGVDNVRDLRERVRYASSGGRYKVYIIDEAHMLSTAAFNALLKTLEEPPPHVIFVLATTEPKRIPPTVLSRCQHLPFRRIGRQKMMERLRTIVEREGVKGSESALDMIARAADGSMRDALTILDQVCAVSDEITLSDLRDFLVITDTGTLSRASAAVIDGDTKGIVSLIAELVNAGTDLRAFAKDLLQFLRNLLIIKIAGDVGGTIEVGDEEAQALSLLKEKTSEEHLALILSDMIRAEPSLRTAFYPRIALEIALLRLCLLSRFSPVGDAIRLVRESASTGPTPGRGHHEKKVWSRPTAPGGNVDTQSEPPSGASPGASRDVPLAEAWSEAIAKLEETNSPLAYKLKEGKCIFGDEAVRIVFNGGLAVHAESVREHLPLIRDLAREYAGRDVAVVIETAKSKAPTKKDLKERALNNPIVKEALELFEGRILDVIPVPKGEENV
jgi:DNA polymerase-3 subunit gamma/tau